jgi:hypothetical protein
MEVTVHWQYAANEFDDVDVFQVLYGYVYRRELLYVGKAEQKTVYERWLARDKAKGLFRDLERERGITSYHIIVGSLMLYEDERFSIPR